jgi:hypothetical protein
MRPLEEVNKTFDEILKAKEQFSEHDCHFVLYDDCNDCNECMQLRDIETYIKYEADWLENKFRPIKEKEIEEHTRDINERER